MVCYVNGWRGTRLQREVGDIPVVCPELSRSLKKVYYRLFQDIGDVGKR